jgi:hypothetical protein
MGVCAFCGDSARSERMTAGCVPSNGGAHEELGSSERPESPHHQGNPPHTFVTARKPREQ